MRAIAASGFPRLRGRPAPYDVSLSILTMILTTVRRLVLPLALLFVALVLGACDTNENPNLLNPPAPDSTLLRVVNLSEGEPIYVKIGALMVAADVGPLEVSPYKAVLFPERVNLIITRGDRSDTLRDQPLTAGVRITVFVATRGRDTRILVQSAGGIEVQDMIRDGIGRATFINAMPDSLPISVRRGCQSGPAVFRETAFGFGELASYRGEPVDFSLYLFAGQESSPRTSAQLPVEKGTITWVVAAHGEGRDQLLAIGPNDVTLRELPKETRTESSIEVLNALGTGAISARIAGVDVATDLEPLQLSTSRTVEACRTATGDSLEVSTASGPLKIPLRMDVGSRALAIVYGSGTSAQALSLRLDPPPGVPERAYVRLVNVSPSASSASLQIGAGAPDSASQAMTFPALPTGQVSGYIALSAGSYPLLLLEAGTGRHLAAGVERLANGYYTMIIADRGGKAEVLVLSHDASSSSLDGFDEPGSRARLFNLMGDASASFSIGSTRIDSLAYSYTAMTVIPATVTSISSNAGDIAVDHSTGSLVIGLTGSGASRTAISFASPAGSPPPGRATVRILNAVPGVAEFTVEIDSVVIARFGEPTLPIERNEGRYSFTVRVEGNPNPVARVTGVELRSGRRYVLAIGPRRASDTSGDLYRALLIQE